MSRETLQSIIQDFQIEKFIKFFREKSRAFKPLQEDLLSFNNDSFSNGLKLGEINLDNEVKLIIVAFQVLKPLSERSGKKAQYELAKKILKAEIADAGIFIFYDEKGDFRFSLVYVNYLGTKRDYSNFRRFTYFVSRQETNKTFINQLTAADFSSLEKIKDAFSVEKVTAEFYKELQSWYFYAMDKIKFPDDYRYSNDPAKDTEIRNATSLIRLITRIIFIYFLKEKKLVPEILFEEEELKKIVKDFKTGSNYYNAILQNLFFATLNQKIEERRFASEDGYPATKREYGVKTLYRYRDKFLNSEEEVLELFKNIPFLNGGLFDCLDKEDETGKVIYIDGFSRNPKKQAIIPDSLFFDEHEKKVDLSSYGIGDNKIVRGLINILSSYNFTIDESTPVDQEVALDPELLGRVFENLLASYNPETATTARKATGSYYTPKEIVDFMVEESLIEYLHAKCNHIFEEQIRALLSYSDERPDLKDEDIEKLISAIQDVKILDPACGSGAFPMGILHKLVNALQKLDPANDRWKELQFQKALEESEKTFRESDKATREEKLKEINEAFDESINYPDYARKLYLIENSIYGVDIQPIAIQIAKLRFFISLVLDQKVDSTKDNFGIRALPNLETRFVAANTLIALEKTIQLNFGRSSEVEALENQLKEIRHRYFLAKTRTEKLRHQEKDKRLREELAKLLINDGWDDQTAKKIASFDLYDQNASVDWFDPEWMFGITDGFDIVIGNPPYGIKIQNTESIVKNYKYFDRQKNSASFFIEVGGKLANVDGVIAFIVPKSLSFSEGWKRTREFVTHKNKLLSVIDVSKAFEAVLLEQVVICFSKKTVKGAYQFYVGEGWKRGIKILGKCSNELIDQIDILPIYIDSKKQAILNKMKQGSIPLSKISKTFRGLPLQSYISKSGHPILRGKNIGKYKIYGNIDKITILEKAFSSLKEKELSKPKIISQNIVAHVMNPYDRIIIMATIDKQGLLTLDTVMNTYLTTDKFALEYVVAILNSNLASWFYYWFVYNRAIRTMHFDKYYIGKLPIKDIDLKSQQPFITIVNQILISKSRDPNADISLLEREIDFLVYKLYELSEEEIKIIENEH